MTEINHVDHRNKSTQSRHVTEEDESGDGACGFGLVSAQLLQGRKQAGGKGKTQCLEVYGGNLASQAVVSSWHSSTGDAALTRCSIGDVMASQPGWATHQQCTICSDIIATVCRLL